jgi:hypothetical protein
MPIDRHGAQVRAADIESWLAELGIEPAGRAGRDRVTSWDLVLDGRRRFDIRTTLILDPGFAAIVWVHYAPPLNDSFRVSYQKMLRWNDQLPFAKFALGEDQRIVLTAELPARTLDRDELGLALARLLAVCDQLLDESQAWLAGIGTPRKRLPAAEGSKGTPEEERVSRQLGLFARYAEQLSEFS